MRPPPVRARFLIPSIAPAPKLFLTRGRRLLIALPALVLFLCLIGLYLTRGSMANLSFLSNPVSSLVDQRPWQTIQQLAPLAVSAEEQNFAQEATRLAAHEVDQAFATALHQASAQAKVLSPQAQALSQKVAGLELAVRSDQARVETLTPKPAPAAGNNPAQAAAPAPSDDLEAAQTQLQLDSDELAEANEDLVVATGDKRAAIEQELAAHEAAVKKAVATTASSQTGADAGNQATGKVAILSARSRGTLSARISAWFDQRSRYGLILEAKRAAETAAASLATQHGQVEARAKTAAAAASASLQQPGTSSPDNPVAPTASAAASPAASNPIAANPADPKTLTRSARLQLLRNLSQVHTLLDDRLQTEQQLAAVYGKWAAQVQRQHSIVLHLMLSSFALIAFIVLCALLSIFAVDIALTRWTVDERRVHTLRTIAGLGIQVVSLLLILLVIFGPPSQVPTILGLATAGVTVVFQDFILAFFGWFVLMGRHGIRVGDRVEINTVAGEVTEIGLFRTTLMETGNWTDRGHPTGRRVTFINNFAITGQFFNFSTAGQWMWDELVVTVPATEATSENIQSIRDRVQSDTGKDSELAMAEWQRSTSQRSLAQINASPSVDLRPSASGIDIIVRYVTRASSRYEIRNTIYQAMIEILRLQPEATPAPGSPAATQ